MIDVIIIGAGPIGLACAIEAKKKGLKYRVFDKGVLVNSLYNYPLNMTFFSTSDKLEIGDVPFISHNSKPTRAEALEYYRRVVSSWELDIKLYEEVIEIKKDNNDHLEQQSYPQHSINDSKRKKLMNVLDDLVQLRKKLDNK